MIVMMPSGVILMYALGVKSSAPTLPSASLAPNASMYVASSIPPPARALTRRN